MKSVCARDDTAFMSVARIVREVAPRFIRPAQRTTTAKYRYILLPPIDQAYMRIADRC